MACSIITANYFPFCPFAVSSTFLLSLFSDYHLIGPEITLLPSPASEKRNGSLNGSNATAKDLRVPPPIGTMLVRNVCQTVTQVSQVELSVDGNLEQKRKNLLWFSERITYRKVVAHRPFSSNNSDFSMNFSICAYLCYF